MILKDFKLLFLILNLSIFITFAQKPASKNKNEDSDESDSSESESTIKLAVLKKQLKLSNKEETFIQNNFDTESLELLEPKSEKDVSQSKLCVLKSRPKKTDQDNNSPAENLKITIEKSSLVKAWYNSGDSRTYCSSDSKKPDQSKLTPMEVHSANEMLNKQRFSKFFPNKSLTSGGKGSNGNNIITFQLYTNSENLKQWSKSKKDSLKPNELENKLKIFLNKCTRLCLL